MLYTNILLFILCFITAYCLYISREQFGHNCLSNRTNRLINLTKSSDRLEDNLGISYRFINAWQL